MLKCPVLAVRFLIGLSATFVLLAVVTGEPILLWFAFVVGALALAGVTRWP